MTSRKEKTYWIYHNTVVLLASIIFALALIQTNTFKSFFNTFAGFRYVGAFIVGFFFPSSFTVVPATAMLVLLSQTLNFALVSLIAAAGATFGDYFIFRFIKDGLADDMQHLFRGERGARLLRVLHSKYFGVLTPVPGMLIMASPLPDELGISLLGLSRVRIKNFVVLSFLLNFVGLLVLLGIFSWST